MPDSMGDRMKGYEDVARFHLVRRMPVIIRVDGKAFHTLTSSMSRPHDAKFVQCMWDAATALCEEIQNARLAYVQSDEISILVVDYHALETQAWFDNGLQKMVSVSAAVATAAFGAAFRERFPDHRGQPLFDSRAFNLPREEVTNYFVWRQQDATRNSIQSTGQAHFSQKELHGLTCDEIQERLFQARGINWNDTPVHLKRGACAVRRTFTVGEATRSRWEVDMAPPIFTKEREYVDRHVNVDAGGPSIGTDTLRRA